MSSAPYSGPAPTPSRSVNRNGEPITHDVAVDNAEQFVPEPHIIDPETLTPGIDRNANTQRFVSNPPADPNEAAHVSENEQRMGELIKALGDQKADHERRMQEQEFMFRSQMAAIASNGNGSNDSLLPANIDPDAVVTAGQLAPVLRSLVENIRATTIRDTLGISQAEEAETITRYPHLQTLPEPRKSEFLKEAVLRQRANAAASDDSRTTPANGNRVAQSPRPPLVTRPARPTAQHTEESNSGSYAEDAPTGNTQQTLRAAYEAAGRLKDPKERNAARKVVLRQAVAASGMSEEEFSKSGWNQR